VTLTDLAWTKRISPMSLVRIAIVAAVLFLSVFLASSVSPIYLILLVGIAGVVVLVRKPELGLIALIVSALVVPFALSTSTQTPVHLAVLLIPLLFGVWVAEMFRRRAFRFVPSKANLPLLLFALSAVISFLVGNLPWNYFSRTASLQSQLGGLAIFVFSAVVFLLVGNLVKDLQWLKWLTGLFLALAGGYIASRIVPGLGWLTSRYPDGSTGCIFWVWIIALAGGQSLFNRALSGRVRLALIALAAATLYVGWSQGRDWVSGWLPPLVTLMVLIWLYSWRLGLAVTIIGGLGILIRDPGLLAGLVSLKQYSIDTRFAAWQIIFVNIIPINPLLGLGPANYYFYTPLFPILGYNVSFNSHNQYVDILAQTGIIGMVVFVWLMLAIGKVGWDLRRRVTDEFARGYVFGCLAGLVGSLYAGVHGDWFIPFVYNIGLAGFRASMLGWLFLGGLVAIEQIISRNVQTLES
jgi:hypothetical protein